MRKLKAYSVTFLAVIGLIGLIAIIGKYTIGIYELTTHIFWFAMGYYSVKITNEYLKKKGE